MVAPRLRQQLVVEGSLTRRWIALVLALAGCALSIIVIARPYHGETTITEQIRSRNILIAIDTSRSMLVQDVSPDRLGSAKTMALELISAFPDDQIGIMAFSGAPVVMAPLTIDHSTVRETVKQLDTRVIPSGGSDLSSAVQLAIETFKKTGLTSNALIIISDGEDHSEKIQLAGNEIRDAGIAVCTIGVGQSEGGIIPDPRNADGKYRDLGGKTVHSRLNPESLDQLARAGGGTYVAASSGADNAIRQALAFLQSDQQSGRDTSIPLESYPWFLVPAIILFILSVVIRSSLLSPRITRPAAAVWLTALLAILNQPLPAATEADRAWDAYQQQDYEAALKLFGEALAHAKGDEHHAMQFSQGSSAYKLQQWNMASRYFSRSLLTTNDQLREESHYNLGNALFQSGWAIMNPSPAGTQQNPFLETMRGIYSQAPRPQTGPQSGPDTASPGKADVRRVATYWQDALAHYREALRLNPQHHSAGHNRREVEKLLQQLRQAEQQAKQEAEQQDKDQQDQKDQSGEQQDRDEGDQDKQDPGKDGEGDSENNPEDRDAGDQQSEGPSGEPDREFDEDQAMERQADESEEAFAARILKEQSDAETRPVSRRFLRLRRPDKDW